MRQEYAHAQRTPPFYMVHSNQFIDFTVNFVLQEMQEVVVEMVAFCIFERYKAELSDPRPAGRMWPARQSCAAAASEVKCFYKYLLN